MTHLIDYIKRLAAILGAAASLVICLAFVGGCNESTKPTAEPRGKPTGTAMWTRSKTGVPSVPRLDKTSGLPLENASDPHWAFWVLPTPARGAQPPMVTAILPATALFDTGSSTLKPEGEQALNRLLADFLALHPTGEIAVSGHTDATPVKAPGDSNLAMSSRRARAAADYLVAHGFPAERVRRIIGFGAARPIADETTAEGRAMNRRVEVEVTAT